MKAKCLVALVLPPAIIGLGLLTAFLSSAAGGGGAMPAEYLPTPRPSEPCDVCEPNNELSQACGPLTAGQNYAFFIRCTVVRDDDLYYIDLDGPARFTADLTSIPQGADYDLYVYGEDGVIKCSSNKPGNPDEHIVCDLNQAGRYYVRVYPYKGCSESDPYTLAVAYPTPPPPHSPPPTPPPLCNVHIDDFSDTNPNNDLNKPSGWKVDPPACDRGTFAVHYTGHELQLDYDLTATAGCTARYTTTLSPSAFPYRALSLRMKSDTARELAGAAVGLRDQAGHEVKVKVADFLNQVVTSTWQAVNVPLAAFATQVQTSALGTFFVEVAGTQGTLYLDSLRLEKSLAPLTVDNFDDRAGPNALGGGVIAITSHPTVTMETAYTTSGTHDGSPGSYVISYSLPSGTWGTWETGLVGLDVSAYAFLSFYVRGASGGEKVNLYLTDGGAWRPPVDVEDYVPGGIIRTDWSLAMIPLRAFQGVDLTDLTGIKFAFEWEPMTGTVLLDDLRFVASALLVDDFCDQDQNNSLNDVADTFASVSPCTGVVTSSISSGALRLGYDVTGGPACFSGYYSWTRLDLNPYRSLAVRVRSTQCDRMGAISAQTIVVPTDKIAVSDYLLDGITDQWQEARIPLAASSAVTDWSRGESYAIAFEGRHGLSQGTTWWDDVGFEMACAPLWLDNFNDEDLVNALVGSWSVSSWEAEITATTSIAQAYGDAGAGMIMSYTVPTGRWAALTTGLRNVNLSDYDSLAFHVKGARGGESPHIYLVDGDGVRGFVELDDYVNVSTEWQTAIIGLQHFGAVDMTRVQALEIIIEWGGTQTQGTLFLDDLVFLPSADCSPDRTFLPMVAHGTTKPPPIYSMWDFESGLQGWSPQTYVDSRAVLTVETSSFRSRSGDRSLAMIVDLIGGDSSQGQGEVFVDMRNHPPPGFSAPVDLECKPIHCWIYVPTCGLGDPVEPNLVSLFVKDMNGNSEYGTPTRVVRNQWFEVTLRPSTLTPEGGFKSPNFNPGAIGYLGVKFRAGRPGVGYRGKVYLDACGWQEIDPS